MNIQKFKKYLKKINSFNEWTGDFEDLSSVEKDLLREYIRKLYESVLGDDVSYKKTKKVKKNQPDSQIQKPIVTDQVSVENESEEQMQQEVIVNENEEEVTSKVEETKSMDYEFSAELLELFDDLDSKDLSEKLSQSPIKSLQKAFSINEKIFAINELFGGDKSAFDAAIKDIDNMNSVLDAREFILKNIVNKYNWDDKSMIKKINQFVKTIKRRFI